jgi:hypothetical protein
MQGFLGFDAAIVFWGVAVLAFSAVRHFYFAPACIQIEGAPHPGGHGSCRTPGRD